MKVKKFFLILILVWSAAGCSAYSASMLGTVVDAETGTPIKDAVVLVEWTKTTGKWMGMPSTNLYKSLEKFTDENGRFKVSGVINPFVNPPNVTIYKKGFVAWNSQYVFPAWEKRIDFNWSDKAVIKLEPFKQDYSRSDHVYFLHVVTHWGKLMNEAYRWEELEKERNK